MTDQGSKPNGPAADFILGEWLVQPSLNRLGRGDETVRLRPQLMELLLCLRSRAGQVVTRDEILSVVWPGQFIAETGLARCIAELRQALGDAAGQDSRYIETIPKRGYRLIASVAQAGPATAATGAVLTASPAASNDVVASAVTVTATGEAGTGNQAEQSARFRRRRVPNVVLVGVAVVVLAGAALAWRYLRPTAVEHDTLVVVFENTTGDAVFDGALRLALVTQVEQSPYLRVVSEQRVRDELRFMNRPPDQPITRAVALDACQRVGAKAVLVGSLAPLGRNYAVGLEGVACQTQEVIAREQVEVTGREQVLGALGQAVSAIRQRLGESVASIRRYDVPIARATTPSLDALKAFSQGEWARAQGRDQDVVRFYRRAIDLDPSFALAHLRLGLHLVNLSQLGEGNAELKRAYAVRDHASDGERLYITSLYHANVLRDSVKAVESLESWRDSYPRNATARLTLASIYGRIGRFQDAMTEVQEALRLDPGNAVAAGIKMEVLGHLGRLEEARKLGLEHVAKASNSFFLHWQLARVAFQLGDDEGIKREIDWAANSPEASNAFLEVELAIATFQGKINEATSLANRRMAAARQAGDLSVEASLEIDQAVSRTLVGQTTEPVALVLSAVQKSRTPENVIWTAFALAAAGELDRSEEFVREYEKMPDVVPTSHPEVRPAVIALITMGRGFPQSALEALAPVRPYEAGWRFNYLPAYVRGLAEMRLRHYDRAMAEFGPITKQLGGPPDSLVYVLAWLQTGRAKVATGDITGARAAYERFLKYWQHADPDLPVLVAAKDEFARLK